MKGFFGGGKIWVINSGDSPSGDVHFYHEVVDAGFMGWDFMRWF